MPITEAELIAGIEAKNGFPLDATQKQAILYGAGPLLIAAGPGTGKTEVLVARCVKFMCCDGVAPGSIMLTTFTEKAAKNLQDRLSELFLFLTARYPQLGTIDPSGLRIGTLHGLCNDILQEYRYTGYQNLRLLDEVSSALLLHTSVVSAIQTLQPDLYIQFGYLFGNKPQYALSKWDWALALQQLFNRLIEDQINVNALQQAGGVWTALLAADGIYEQALANAAACDFSRLLRYFREFLDTAQGNIFLNGDGSGVRLPLTHVLVDEYQDTNPIQESIYLRLADNLAHNITVVGDDDQALYRFRGGTVECMVGFPSACLARWGANPAIIYLSDNHRSDKDIVDRCNAYISSFPQMAAPNVRIAGKPPLNSAVGRTGSHPAVGLIRKGKVIDCATDMATLISDLRTNGVIQDYSQCVLLLRSTKNSPNFAGPYVGALQARNIPVYNPRSKDYLEQIEVAQFLGAFVRIIDPQLTHISSLLSPSIKQMVQGWVGEYDAIAPANPSLSGYVVQAAQAIAAMGIGQRITPATPTILYRILAHQPFQGYQASPEMDLRLSKLTRLFESFCSQYGRALWTDKSTAGQLPGWWYGSFYYGLCGYLEKKGLDDDEDEEVVCPAGYFPIMTVHQAKGLEFDFVFVGNLGGNVSSSSAHQLEEDLRPFRFNPPLVTHPISASQWHDDIRQHFVAFSRARFALVLMATDGQLRKTGSETASFGNQGGAWVRQNTPRL
uniref:DNA 3'-5' helicase n=1 Tax=mine drainage metagenome TaxID=410659 RepID=E6PXQ5_9ZZZZ